jgi:hypothetical protein
LEAALRSRFVVREQVCELIAEVARFALTLD